MAPANPAKRELRRRRPSRRSRLWNGSRLAREQHAAGTIIINEVIEQFDLSTTPEEILAALSANRRVQHLETPQKAQAKRQSLTGRSRILARVAIAVFLALGVFLLGAWAHFRWASPAQEVDISAITAAPQSEKSPRALSSLVDSLVVIDKTSDQPVSKLMSEVPDSRSVQVSDDALEETLSIHRERYGELGNDTGWWTARKEHHRFFLKGFLPMRVSPGVAALGDLVITNRAYRDTDTTSSPVPAPVWFPADSIRSIESDGGDKSKIIVDGLKPGELQYDTTGARP